jgi:hypothetical protein
MASWLPFSSTAHASVDTDSVERTEDHEPNAAPDGVCCPAGQSDGATESLFGEDFDLPPTWSKDSRFYHTSEKCSRLKSIARSNRDDGKPGRREHCAVCADIAATKRRG